MGRGGSRERQPKLRRIGRRGRAGRRLDFVDATPDALAEAIATELGRPVDYLPVRPDGAARAAALLAALL